MQQQWFCRPDAIQQIPYDNRRLSVLGWVSPGKTKLELRSAAEAILVDDRQCIEAYRATNGAVVGQSWAVLAIVRDYLDTMGHPAV